MIEITRTMVIAEKELKDKFLNVSLVGREGHKTNSKYCLMRKSCRQTVFHKTNPFVSKDISYTRVSLMKLR